MIVTIERKKIRQAVLEFQHQIRNDTLYNTIYSVKQKDWYLHARSDHPEIRAKFFEYVRKLEGFKCFIVIGRKKLDLFNRKHDNKPEEFYFDLLYHLLKDRLREQNAKYKLYLSSRQKSNQSKFANAVNRAIERDNTKRKKPK
jgi:hypothetical protein